MKKLVINPGDTFPNKHWKVIREVTKRGKHRYFLCECLLCTGEYEVDLSSLKNKNSCFCCKECSKSSSKYFERKADELIGKVFGRLTVISKHSQNKYDQWKYLCRCECDNEKVILGYSLKNNNSTSCGCYNKERNIEAHSGKNSHLWIDGRSTQNELDRARIKQRINPIIRMRDNHTCQNCSQYKGWLEVHHIFDFSNYPELKFEESNLIVLCRQCHLDFHSIYPTYETNTLNDLEKWMGKEYKYRIELLQLL